MSGFVMDQPGTTISGPAAGRPLLLRPPFLFATAIAAGIVLHLAWPLSFVSRAVRWPIGVMLSMAGVALFVAAIRAFDAAGTPVPGNRSTTAIVRSGPYRFSRNPIYVAFALIHLGVAASFGSWWLLMTLTVSIGVIAISVIPREERYLEARFRSSYRAYKSSVRRWL
jgi:protein-S-isoprenylcysteine O-methyltransferase Ste14